MAWLLALPLWAKLALTFGVTLVLGILLCNVIGGPKNPHNYQADTLAATRKAYVADTERLVKQNDSLKAYADSQRVLKEVERQKWIEAEQRAAVAKVSASNARAQLAKATNVRDSLAAAMIVIAAQDTVIKSLTSALESSHAAFGRLTAENTATLQRADSLDAGWRRTRDRLGIAEAALAVEQKRTGCSINLLVTHVNCPSRGVVGVVGVAAGAVGAVLLRPKA